MRQIYNDWCDQIRPRQAFHVSISLSKCETESKLGTIICSETDSFIRAMKTDDVYRDLEKVNANFYLSNYDEDHFLFNDTNKKVVLKFKDETCAKPIGKFIAINGETTFGRP